MVAAGSYQTSTWSVTNTTTQTAWSNTNVVWVPGIVLVPSSSNWGPTPWEDDWLNRLVRSCRRARRERHLEALGSLPPRSVPPRPPGPSKVSRWLTLVCRTRG